MRLYDQVRPNFAFVNTGIQYEVLKDFLLLGRVGAIRFGETADFYSSGSGDLASYEFGAMLGVGYRSVVGPVYIGYARNTGLDFGLFNIVVGHQF